jgi:hypothetical protein
MLSGFDVCSVALHVQDWVALGTVDLDEFLEKNLNNVSDWELNFKVTKPACLPARPPARSVEKRIMHVKLNLKVVAGFCAVRPDSTARNGWIRIARFL